MFDEARGNFNTQRVQDELVGQMAELLQADYDTLMFEITEPEVRQHALRTALAVPLVPPTLPVPEVTAQPHNQMPMSATGVSGGPPPVNPPASKRTSQQDIASQSQTLAPSAEDATAGLLQAHIVSPAQTTERLQSIQKLIADQLGEEVPPDFENSVLQAIPVQAGGLYPISDVWYIEPGIDTPDRLRTHIAQFAREIADEASLSDCIEDRDEGIGFVCRVQAKNASSPTVLVLLASLAGQPLNNEPSHHILPTLLLGQGDTNKRLSDTALVKLFRLTRLARRLLDLEAILTDDES